MSVSKTLALVAVLVGCVLGVSVAHAGKHQIFATVSLHPAPGSGYSAGGGGVLYTDGSASGAFTRAVVGSQTVTHARPFAWSSSPIDGCNPPSGGVCLCFDVTVLPGEPFHATQCLPLQFGENTNVTNDPVIITLTRFD